MGNFFVDSAYEPKRNFRFTVTLGSPERLMFEAKTVNKPKLNFATVELNSVDGTSVYFPASPSWQPVTLTLTAGGVDDKFSTAKTDVSRGIVELLALSGYERYGDRIYKGNSADALGEVAITQINSAGSLVEEWTLINPYIESVDFGNLDYSSDDLSELTVTFRYDHAEVKYGNSDRSTDNTEFIKTI